MVGTWVLPPPHPPFPRDSSPSWRQRMGRAMGWWLPCSRCQDDAGEGASGCWTPHTHRIRMLDPPLHQDVGPPPFITSGRWTPPIHHIRMLDPPHSSHQDAGPSPFITSIPPHSSRCPHPALFNREHPVGASRLWVSPFLEQSVPLRQRKVRSRAGDHQSRGRIQPASRGLSQLPAAFSLRNPS